MTVYCPICCRRCVSGDALFLHVEAHHSLDAIRAQVRSGLRHDWNLKASDNVWPRHNVFMQSNIQTSRRFTWRVQLAGLLAKRNVRLEDGAEA